MIGKAATELSSLNAEQKAFIDNLVKNNLSHGDYVHGAPLHGRTKSKVSRSKVSKPKDDIYHHEVITDYTYNGKPANYNKLYDYIRPGAATSKHQTEQILLEILEKKTYTHFN